MDDRLGGGKRLLPGAVAAERSSSVCRPRCLPFSVCRVITPGMNVLEPRAGEKPAGGSLVRLPRFFEKKRGERRTGSQAWASVGEAAFYAALLLAGLIVGGLLVSGVAVPEWRINHDFLPSQGVVLGKGLQRRSVADPPGVVHTTWAPVVRLRFPAEGVVRDAWSRPLVTAVTPDRETAIRRLEALPEIGSETPCWFDPESPETVVLKRGYNWSMWLLTLLLPGALVAFGGAGLLRSVRAWGKSEEHRAVAAGLPEQFAPTGQAPVGAPGFPGVPACDDLVNSPGTILSYRLPIESPESWALLGFGLFALVWNAVLVVLAVGAGLDLMGGRIDWLLLGLIVPFAVVGIGGVVLFIRGLVQATSMGPTQFEVSDHPLRPGRSYEVLVAHGGSGMLQMMELCLEAEEQATFRQGTDTRTERVVVWRQSIKQWRDIELSSASRFEAEATIRLPDRAMHSFHSEHNVVSWRFVVRGVLDTRPPFCRVFPVVVFPAAAASSAARPVIEEAAR